MWKTQFLIDRQAATDARYAVGDHTAVWIFETPASRRVWTWDKDGVLTRVEELTRRQTVRSWRGIDKAELPDLEMEK